MAPEIPFDILHRIFNDYASDSDLEQLFNLRWTKLMLVCRQWHVVGMSSPRLWSYISFEPPLSIPEIPSSEESAAVEADVRRVRTQISRAGTWPLTIRYKQLPWTCPDYFQELGSSLFWCSLSVQSLSLRGDYIGLKQNIHDICKEMHSNLRSLELQQSELNMSNIITLGHDLTKRLPSLRHLNLRDVRCDWSCIRDLRSLRLSHAITMLQPYQLQDIKSALERCPDLEELYLEMPFWRPTDQSPSTTDMISLPNLADIRLRGPVHICAPLLLSFDPIALGASIDISFNGVHPRDERNLERVESRIGEYLRRPGSPSVLSLTWGNSAVDGRIAIAGSHDLVLDDSAKPSIRLHASTKRPPLGLSNCLASWPLEDVTCLDMRPISICASGVWRALFSALPALQTVAIRVERSPIEELILVLEELLQVGRRPVSKLYLDASALFSNAYHAQLEERRHRSTQTLGLVMRYCAKAAHIDLAVDEVQLVDPNCCLVSEDMDWRLYYGNLAVGFRYNGVMHNQANEVDKHL